jgi:hypothetical protein
MVFKVVKSARVRRRAITGAPPGRLKARGVAEPAAFGAVAAPAPRAGGRTLRAGGAPNVRLGGLCDPAIEKLLAEILTVIDLPLVQRK